MYTHIYMCIYVLLMLAITIIRRICVFLEANWSERSTRFLNEGRFCLSIDLVCKVEKSALEYSSISFCRSTFRVSFHGFMQKRPRNHSIPPKLSVANSFNKEGKLDSRLLKLWVSYGFFNKRDLWKMMHRQTKYCKLSRSTDRNDPETFDVIVFMWVHWHCRVVGCEVCWIAMLFLDVFAKTLFSKKIQQFSSEHSAVGFQTVEKIAGNFRFWSQTLK